MATIGLIITIFAVGFLLTTVFNPLWDAIVANSLVASDPTTAFLKWVWNPGIPIILTVLFGYWFLKETQKSKQEAAF